jgi:hypothetical protein
MHPAQIVMGDVQTDGGSVVLQLFAKAVAEPGELIPSVRQPMTWICRSRDNWPEPLKKHGLQETEASIANKISRGTFSAMFLLAPLKALEREQLNLQDI